MLFSNMSCDGSGIGLTLCNGYFYLMGRNILKAYIFYMYKTNVRLLIHAFIGFLVISPCIVRAEDHLSFKQVPITGTLNEFCNTLFKNGFEQNTQAFKPSKDIPTTAYLKGQFASDACDLMVFATKQSLTVWKVSMSLPIKDDWLTLNYQYFLLKSELKKKFGTGESHEYFEKPYTNNDLNEMTALRRKKCTYMTYWKVNSGAVLLEICREGRITVSFEDALNTVLKNSEE